MLYIRSMYGAYEEITGAEGAGATGSGATGSGGQTESSGSGEDRATGELEGSLRKRAGRPRGIVLYGLKTARVEAELFANELSEKSGVHKNTIYRLEKLVTGADPLTIRKLCRALSVEPAKLRQPPEESPY